MSFETEYLLISFVIAISANFIYSYLLYVTIPLLISFPITFLESLKLVFLPAFIITFVFLEYLSWSIVLIPFVIILLIILRKIWINKRKKLLSEIKQKKYIPIIEKWINIQNNMKVKKYYIFINKKGDNLETTVYIYIDGYIDYVQIKELEKILPFKTTVRIESTQKKRIALPNFELKTE